MKTAKFKYVVVLFYKNAENKFQNSGRLILIDELCEKLFSCRESSRL